MRQLRNILKVSINSILRNRTRSLLTSLGIIIGVCAVIVMVAIGSGSSAKIEKEIAGLGANLIIIRPGHSQAGGVSQGAGSFNRFTMDDVKKVKQEATLLQWVSPMVRTNSQVIAGSNNWSTDIMGVSPEYLSIRDWSIANGELFSERDVLANRKVAVLGKTVADQLFPYSDPIGESIRIRNTPFRVIGVLTEKGQSGMGQDQDDVILAPSTTVLYRLKGGRYIDMIYVSAVSTDLMSDAQEELHTILRASQRLGPSEEDNFDIRNQAEIAETVSEMSRIMTMLLGSIAGVSLIVGGIGIMNIMLVSVTERTREIGIRLSVGARASDVLVQFLTEAIVLSLIGGIIGILLAFLISVILNRFTELYTLINPGIVILSFCFAGAVGIFFGYYPAKRASALNPIDALRYE